MTIPTTPTTPSADPLDAVLAENDHATLDAVIAASMADDALANDARRLIRYLAARLASAEQANADLRALWRIGSDV